MTLLLEHVAHTCFLKNEFFCVLEKALKASAKGQFNRYISNWVNLYFSYDGLAFRSHADAKNEHYYTSLANIDGSPLVVGGSSPDTKKVEIYDISTNKWTEVADYPYHD